MDELVLNKKATEAEMGRHQETDVVRGEQHRKRHSRLDFLAAAVDLNRYLLSVVGHLEQESVPTTIADKFLDSSLDGTSELVDEGESDRTGSYLETNS